MEEEIVDVQIKKYAELDEIGHWLETNMPNPPIDEPQRWTLGYDVNMSRMGIRFFNKQDAFLFSLVWAC